ncbi:hypothetical protein B0H63DRAFT_311964 [Podospora didyma]|uniref:Uncharacterized protein n=1 Tax=Podospora didyma TaxID=330526 RepID=A0AAE0N4A1_9PEZI|nr:hypothetical protein B0H63DRAFT_311964 [Podospora didyma]
MPSCQNDTASCFSRSLLASFHRSFLASFPFPPSPSDVSPRSSRACFIPLLGRFKKSSGIWAINYASSSATPGRLTQHCTILLVGCRRTFPASAATPVYGLTASPDFPPPWELCQETDRAEESSMPCVCGCTCWRLIAMIPSPRRAAMSFDLALYRSPSTLLAIHSKFSFRLHETRGNCSIVVSVSHGRRIAVCHDGMITFDRLRWHSSEA